MTQEATQETTHVSPRRPSKSSKGSKSSKSWVLKITASWQQAVISILETGRLLNEAKDAL